MRTLRVLLFVTAFLLGSAGFAGAASAQDDTDTGYSLDAEADALVDEDAGYATAGAPDAEVMGANLARTGTNVFFLALIGGAAIAVGVGLDRWSSRLEVES